MLSGTLCETVMTRPPPPPLKCNGYPEWILRDLKEENNSDSEKEVETSGETVETSRKEKSKKIPVVIPYVKGFSEQMRRAFGKYGIPMLLLFEPFAVDCGVECIVFFVPRLYVMFHSGDR